jgi:DNA polymerase elongation subunit (family B)
VRAGSKKRKRIELEVENDERTEENTTNNGNCNEGEEEKDDGSDSDDGVQLDVADPVWDGLSDSDGEGGGSDGDDETEKPVDGDTVPEDHHQYPIEEARKGRKLISVEEGDEENGRAYVVGANPTEEERSLNVSDWFESRHEQDWNFRPALTEKCASNDSDVYIQMDLVEYGLEPCGLTTYMFGITSEGHSVLARIVDCIPYLYFKCPAAWQGPYHSVDEGKVTWLLRELHATLKSSLEYKANAISGKVKKIVASRDWGAGSSSSFSDRRYIRNEETSAVSSKDESTEDQAADANKPKEKDPNWLPYYNHYKDELIYVDSWSSEVGYECNEYRKDTTCFIKVPVAYPDLIRKCLVLLQDYAGGPRKTKDGQTYIKKPWLCQELMNEVNPLEGELAPFEAKLEFTMRFNLDRGLCPQRWVKVKAGSYQIVKPNDRISYCQREFSVPYEELDPIDIPADMVDVVSRKVNLVFDIETKTGEKGRFPKPETEPVIIICASVFVDAPDTPAERAVAGRHAKFVFCLNQCTAPEMYPDAFIYSFPSGTDLLLVFRRFFIMVDPDMVSGYNSHSFDTPFLIDRSVALGIGGVFPYLGKLIGVPTTVYVTNFESSASGRTESKFSHMPGRTQLDVLLYVKGGFKFISYTLNYVANKLVGDQKEVIAISEINGLSETPEGMGKLVQYCMKDVEITAAVMRKILMVEQLREFARVTRIDIDKVHRRGQQIRVQNLMYHYGKDEEAHATGHVYYFPIPKDGTPYKGAMVHDPKRGVKYAMPNNEDQTIPLTELPDFMVDFDKHLADTVIHMPYDGRTKERILEHLERSYSVKKPTAATAADASAAPCASKKKSKKVKPMEPGMRTITDAFASAGRAVERPAKKRKLCGSVITLDFSAMYPTTMLAENYCITTYLPPAREKEMVALGWKEGKDADYEHVEDHFVDEANNKVVCFKPIGGHCFVNKKHRRGLICKVLDTMLEMRGKAKTAMKKLIEGSNDYNMQDGRQLAAKVSSNSCYGATGVASGAMACTPVADSITGTGRKMINIQKAFINRRYRKSNGYPADVDVVYGDTDSVMPFMEGMTILPALVLGELMSRECTRLCKSPHVLALEKGYAPYVLYEKKRYMGEKYMYGIRKVRIPVWVGEGPEHPKSLWRRAEAARVESLRPDYVPPPVHGTIEVGVPYLAPQGRDKVLSVEQVTGMENKRRDAPPYIAKLITDLQTLVLKYQDVDGAIDLVKQVFSKINNNEMDLGDLIVSKKLNKPIDDYVAPPPKKGKAQAKYTPGPHVMVAKLKRKRDPSSAPHSGDRVPYVLVSAGKKARVSDMAEDPAYAMANGIPINSARYVEQMIKPIVRFFAPILDDRGTTPQKEFLSIANDRAKNKQMHLRRKQVRIPELGGVWSKFVKREPCAGCRRGLEEKNATRGICDDCMVNAQDIRALVAEELAAKQTEYMDYWGTCQKCMGAQNAPKRITCINDDCAIRWKRAKADIDEKRLNKRMRTLDW